MQFFSFEVVEQLAFGNQALSNLCLGANSNTLQAT